MTAAAADRQTSSTEQWRIRRLTLTASAVIYAGTMVGVAAAGTAAAAANAAGVIVEGVSTHSADEAAGDDYVVACKGSFWMANGSNAVEAADIGRLCWVEDDSTVGDRPGTFGTVAGWVEDVDATKGVLVGFYENHPQSIAIEALTVNAAVSVDTLLTDLTVNTTAYTLADGRFAGQIKIIRCAAVTAATGVVTAATTTYFTTATFNAAEDVLVLLWTGVAWKPLANVSVTLA